VQNCEAFSDGFATETKRLRRRSRARLKWTEEFLAVLGTCDSMRRLLFEIEDQMARGDTWGLAQKCARALKMWDRFEAVIAASGRLSDEKQTKPNARCRAPLDPIRAMLEAGVAGSRTENCSSTGQEDEPDRRHGGICLRTVRRVPTGRCRGIRSRSVQTMD